MTEQRKRPFGTWTTRNQKERRETAQEHKNKEKNGPVTTTQITCPCNPGWHPQCTQTPCHAKKTIQNHNTNTPAQHTQNHTNPTREEKNIPQKNHNP